MGCLISRGTAWRAAEPLWKRVPTRGEDGRPLSDFMMLIPGLSRQPVERLEHVLQAINEVLIAYRDVVVFADMNLRLNVLWLSVRPVPGICLELPIALKLRVPEAKLIAHKIGRER